MCGPLGPQMLASGHHHSYDHYVLNTGGYTQDPPGDLGSWPPLNVPQPSGLSEPRSQHDPTNGKETDDRHNPVKTNPTMICQQ